MVSNADRPLPSDDHDPATLLEAAIDRATRLVGELERKAGDLKKNPPQIPAEELEMGMLAMDAAVASARRMLENLLLDRDAEDAPGHERDE